MRRFTTVLGAILTVAGALVCRAVAQENGYVTSHGTFGPRVLGSPLQPRVSPFSNTIHLGPSGNFLGIATSPNLPPPPAEIPAMVPVDLVDIVNAVQARPVMTPLAPVEVVPVEVPSPVVVPSEVPTPGITPATPSPVTAPVTTPLPSTPPGPATPPELPMRRSSGTNRLPTPSTVTSTGMSTRNSLPASGGVYTPLRAGFSSPLTAADEQMGTRLTSQLGRSSRLQSIAPIQVTVQGDTATLQGTVASSYDRLVAEQVVRMEAGIWNVDNRLQVSPHARLSATASTNR